MGGTHSQNHLIIPEIVYSVYMNLFVFGLYCVIRESMENTAETKTRLMMWTILRHFASSHRLGREVSRLPRLCHRLGGVAT